MDTSKQYIEMCRKVQKYLDPKCKEIWEGDTIFYNKKWGMYFKEQFYLEGTYSDGSLIVWEREIFKLYRQDQLQDMIKPKNKLHIHWAFHVFTSSRYTKETAQNACIVLNNMLDGGVSMEQLWLAFVMKEKFNKTWNGTDWKLGED